jgi:hypothetical protein
MFVHLLVQIVDNINIHVLLRVIYKIYLNLRRHELYKKNERLELMIRLLFQNGEKYGGLHLRERRISSFSA